MTEETLKKARAGTMSHLSPGLLSAYNSLTDKHLAGYFSNTRIRRHLQRAGLVVSKPKPPQSVPVVIVMEKNDNTALLNSSFLYEKVPDSSVDRSKITRSGRIVPDKEYRHKLIQRSHQKHVRECLAQAIFHKVLEMERVHQIEIKRKLEEFARRERVHKIKVERSKRYEEEIVHILSPRPPTGARGIRQQHSGPDGEHSESSESPGSSRPNTAPGKMQRPVRLKPIHSNSTTASLRRSSPYRLHEFSNDNNQPFNCTVNKESRRPFNTMEASQGVSPYILPVINNFVTPVPPPTKRIDRRFKLNPSSTLRGRRLRPTTASSGADITEDPPMLRSSVHQSRVCVNMMYFGKSVHLSHDLTDMRDEVRVFQQHCGGENLCVFKGKLCEGETFQFISRRHRGFPFSLTFFLNGLQVERLSSCCEFKHRKGSRLGGRHGHFGFCGVEGASPCYKCIIAMGLDKKPTPPPKRVKEDRGREESVFTLKEAPEMRAQRTGSHSESETIRAQDMEVQVKEETAAEEEDKVRDDYEEDFEADDEGPAEDTEAKEKKSPSPRVEMERKVKERDTSETEDDHEKDEDLKSRSGSSLSGSDREESDAEVTKSSREEEKAEQPKEADEEETAVPPDKKDEPQRGETPPTEAESAAPKESDVPNSAGERTESNISDTSLPSGNENKQSDNTSGEKEVEKTVNESKQEKEQERAKSVQEKMAEAILKESHCSSEPELSDTSTEDTIESITKGHERDHKDAAAEKSTTTIEQETKCDEGVVALAVVVLDQEQSSEKKEQEPVEKEIKDEQDEEYEEDGKVISEEDKSTAENDESEETHDLGAALFPVPKEKTDKKEKTSEAQEDLADKPTVTAEKKEDNEEKAVVEAYVHPQETGQGSKSSEGDESSLSAPDKKTDETAEPDNVEAMTASETVEMKAESSEEQEALSCEEAPVTGTETSQLGDIEDRAAESKTEVTEGSRDPTDEITADKSQDNAKDESINDIDKESVSAVDASNDDNQQQKEEQPKQSVEMDDKKEEKSEEGGKEAEKQTNADETTEGEDCRQRQMHGKDKTEEENNESKIEERIENISNEEQAEKTNSEEDEVANVEKADTSEKTEKDEESECIKNQNEEESAEKIATTLITSAAEKISETITAGDEAKQSVAEKATREPIENKAEQNEAANNKDSEESVRKKVVTYTTVEVEEKSEKAKESHKRADGDIDQDYVKKSDGNNESEDVGDSEAANIALATVMAAEMLNQTMEAEDVTKNPERGGDNNDEAEIDAENGEISAGAERKPQEDEGQDLIEGANGITTAEQTEEEEEEERKTEASKEDSTEVKEGDVESGDAAEKHEEDVAQAPASAVVEIEANEEDDRVEEQDQPAKNESELEKSGTGIKEESESDKRRDTEETKQDENANLSESDHKTRETRESDNVNEVIVVSPIDHDQSTSPTAVDSDDTALKLESSTAPSDSNTEKQPDTEENPAVADLSAADGENGDTEEASKASEEGASVLLKPPPAESIQLSQQNEADRTEKSVDVVEETPEDLAREDLVTNWVTMHQTSKYFETFVEPLEDLKEVTEDADVSNSNKEGTQSTELQRSVTPPANSQNVEQEHTPNDINESVEKTKEGAEKLDIESDHPDDGDPCEKSLEKDLPQEKEETEVHDFITKTDSGQIDEESVVGQDLRPEEHTERCESVEEDQVHRVLMQDNTDQTHDSKTEVESIAGANLSVTSGKPESIKEYQIDEKTTDNPAEINDKITAVGEEKDLPSSKAEEHGELSATPERLSTLRKSELEGTEETLEKSREVTEISDFTQSRSDDGSQEESRHEEINPKPPDADTNGESRELQLIQDIKHTLSKDQLSTYSVDETLFPRSSYPLLAVASTESGH